MIVYSAQQVAELIVCKKEKTGEIERRSEELFTTIGALGEPVLVETFHESAQTRTVLKDLETGIEDLQQRGFSKRQIETLYSLFAMVLAQEPAPKTYEDIAPYCAALVAKLSAAMMVDTGENGTAFHVTMLTAPEDFRYDMHLSPEH